MTTLVDQTIAELRANHDRLAAFVGDLTEEQLKSPSGAAEWTIADVLSHLGSGAELQHHSVGRAVSDQTGEGDEVDNQAVWDRWNALPPTGQAAAFVDADERLVTLYESLTPEQREKTVVDLGYLPAPVPVATPLGMRLNEQAMHGWDARVGVDPEAAVSDEAADLLLRHFTDTMGFMFGFIGKADRLAGTARIGIDDAATIVVTDSVSLVAGADLPTARFVGPREAVVRLFAGRLAPEHTPADVTLTGDVSLDDLRQVFPGY